MGNLTEPQFNHVYYDTTPSLPLPEPPLPLQFLTMYEIIGEGGAVVILKEGRGTMGKEFRNLPYYVKKSHSIFAYVVNSMKFYYHFVKKILPVHSLRSFTGNFFSLHGNRISSHFYTAHIENSYLCPDS